MSFGAGVAVAARRYGTESAHSVSACRVAPVRSLRIDDSSSTMPAKLRGSNWCNRW